MSGLLTRAGYEPIAGGNMAAAKEEVVKLPPGAVVVTAMKFARGTAQELVNCQKEEGFSFPVIALVNNLNGSDLLDATKGDGIFLFLANYTNVLNKKAIFYSIQQIN